MVKLSRRKFLSVSGGSLGLFSLTGGRSHAAEPIKAIYGQPAANASTVDVAVIGAGAFGGWTALYLREMGLSVALIDAYGPGNARAASGGETRQIRAGYGEREIYTRWVLEAFKPILFQSSMISTSCRGSTNESILGDPSLFFNGLPFSCISAFKVKCVK